MSIETCPLTLADIQSELAEISEIAVSNSNKKMFEKALSCIDLTTLNLTDTISSVAAFTGKVNQFPDAFPGISNIAAICVYPNMAHTVKNTLKIPGIKIAAVAGGFPSSMTFTKIKIEEAQLAVLAGANEIDIVLPLWAYLEGHFETCTNEISAIKKAIGDAHLKVILETGVLNVDQIWQASILAIEAGADFIKTSTGKMPQAASPEAAFVMCLAIKQHFEETGMKIGFKPAGGIVTPEDAILYLTIVQEILGNQWLTPELFRIGASRLANNLLEKITGSAIKHF
ncbi:MAG: deoxyribose-phosphate aldolase [Bacteroidota bacterium]|nr:deoxyribose-phosphate aldolase [Odoribacter sp.]MDP3643770.1 deoxyribose-phosphate aldolase [Bacteroidota bacterium]